MDLPARRARSPLPPRRRTRTAPSARTTSYRRSIPTSPSSTRTPRVGPSARCAMAPWRSTRCGRASAASARPTTTATPRWSTIAWRIAGSSASLPSPTPTPTSSSASPSPPPATRPAPGTATRSRTATSRTTRKWRSGRMPTTRPTTSSMHPAPRSSARRTAPSIAPTC